MGDWIELGVQAEADEKQGPLRAYRAMPNGAPRGGVVVTQEIFGVNGHIRSVADRFASLGYAALAPALFDRVERDVELAYDEEGIARGRELRNRLGWDAPVADIRTSIAALMQHGKVAVVGYCWGGSLAWLSGCRAIAPNLPACAVAYYGGQIFQWIDERPKVPMLMHFGELDAGIPGENVEAIRAAHPGATIYTYPAGHGFNCDKRADFDEPSARLALERTLAFFDEHLARS